MIAATATTPRLGVVAEDLDEIVDRAAVPLRRLAGCRVVVTGAAGFLGSYVVDALARANDRGVDQPTQIVCVDNLATGVGSRLGRLEGRGDVAICHADLSRELPLDGSAEYVLHAASIASPSRYREHPLATIDVNVGGTRRLLEYAVEAGVRGFLQLSSSEIYGDPPPAHVPTAETYWGHVSSIGPRACYDESKRLGETLCMTYHRQHAVPVKIARPFNVYGPRLRLDDGRVIPDFMRDALDGAPITVYSDGRATRSFCYVTDAVVALLLLLTADVAGDAFNVGNDEEVAIGDVARIVDSLRPSGAGVRFASHADPAYLSDNPQRRCPDLSKLRARVGYEPQVALVDGLARTYRHYLEERQ